MEHKMQFSLGTNFDPKLIEAIKTYDTQKVITSLYGKFARDIAGGGRSTYILQDISWKGLAQYIQLCHDSDIEFNYLLNAMCMSNMEYEKAGNRKLLRFIGRLSNLGIDAITTNSAYLCEILKKKYPEIKVTIGLFTRISCLEHIRRWERHGADELTLVPSLNRDFNYLEKILIYTRQSGIKLRLIANNVCVRSCHMGTNHGTVLSHTSQKNELKDRTLFDFPLYKCTIEKLRYPVNLIASEWIRPEDIKHYENLCAKTGNYNLSIKLVERTKNTAFLERVVKAYTSRSFDGNLLDILNWPDKTRIQKLHITSIGGKAVLDRYNIKKLLNFYDMFNLPEIKIDNKKLDGFIEKFIQEYPCATNLCDLNDNTNHNLVCSYCRRWAEKAISFSEEKINEWLSRADCAADDLVSGKIFGGL